MSAHEYVVAFDPGPHTGVAVFYHEALARTELFEDTGTPNSLARQYVHLYDLVEDYRGVKPVFIVESYQSALTLNRDGIATIKLIGWIHGLALFRHIDIVFQMPMQKTPFLGEAGRYNPADNHRHDAIAHALAYYATHPYEKHVEPR